jgi:hypothetical protein
MPEMLAICRAKAEKLGLSPTLYQQNMESLDLPRTYRTILAPSSALQRLTSSFSWKKSNVLHEHRSE